ncbi:hypothetical protein BJX66DRAFT_225347 [Aspergillus keveii]|uniref:Zn(2)-C6 fungal-type domain-containing protein n=1 Tax=Aspergillus keveii TaxID=714993 RepID=A0ABR4G2Z3_9EURO
MDTAARRQKARVSNACHRCKSKKLRCHFTGQTQHKCRACEKANLDCVFDVTPDGLPRGAAYIESLEAQVASLKEQLREAQSNMALREPSVTIVGRDNEPSVLDGQSAIADQRQDAAPSEHSVLGGTIFGFTELVERQV